MKDENKIIALLIKRATGEIDDAELATLQSILATHPDAPYYERFVSEVWKSAAEQYDTEILFERHLARHAAALSFTNEDPVKPKVKGRVFSISLMAAAAVLVIFTIGYPLFNKSGISAGSDTTNFVEYIAKKGIKKQITLPDGTTAWLNSDSKLSYPADFGSGKTRPVHLEGEAYFDVAKDKNRPFTIATDKITIKVLGTSFNVKAYPEETKTETTLISGEIELSVNERPSEKIRMKPNEKVEVVSEPPANNPAAAEGNQLTVTIGNISKVLVADEAYIKEASWKDNKLIFKNEPFNELIIKLERWYNVDFTLENAAVADYRYTGNITKESLTQTLDGLQLIHFFNYKIEGHDVIVY